jgi:hypothetical protein
MTILDQTIQQVSSLNFPGYMSEKTIYHEKHGFIYQMLIYFSMFTTIFLITYLKAPKFYKRMISKFLNINFSWRGTNWKVFHFLFLVILSFGMLFVFFKMQIELFSQGNPTAETTEKRIFRLKYKWLLEAEIWLLSMIIIELLYI